MGEVKMGGHIPVLLKEVMDALAVRPGGRYVDGTLGRAGHTKEIIARGGMVLGIDRDEQAIREIGEVAGLSAVRGRHGDLKEIANEKGWSLMKPDAGSAFCARDPLTCAWIGRAA